MSADRTSRKIVSVILAAGKGTRMKSPYLHKVCFPLEGRSVIARAIEGYQRCGVQSHFLVVGPMAEQVMEAASSAPGNLFFCHQAEQHGTGDAARAAARLLQAMDYEGDILLVAGDKVIEDEILEGLIDAFYKTGSDLAFVVGNASEFTSSGRIIYGEDSRPLGNVEVFDIAKMHLLRALRGLTHERPVPADEAESLALKYLRQEKKAALALGSLWDAIKMGLPVTGESLAENFSESDYAFHMDDKEISPDELDDALHANLSVYLFKARALYESLEKLTSDNAQQEEYLTDTIGILASMGRKLTTVPIAYPQQVMAFNTPEELKDIEEYLASKKAVTVLVEPRTTRRVREWLHHFESASPDSIQYLSRVYGEDNPNMESKRRLLTSMLRSYLNEFGNEDVIITRAPGRVNIMGRHIDHQGGHGNMIAVDRDVYLVIGARKDRQVHLRNLAPHQFADRNFDIDELMADYHGGSWLDFLNSQAVRDKIAAAHGDWAQYIKSPIVRFQVEYPDHRLKGMNILVAGSIPIAAGLSSSSAMVTATTEGLVALNGLDVAPERFVELCGEGEWYVGTMGGAGDHAAMKFARQGQVVQVGFFPFGATDTVPFPADYLFVVCNSHVKARKSAGAKDMYNHRVACYNIGRELLKKEFPEHAEKIQHLRDFNVRTLGVGCIALLRMLKRLPESITRQEIAARITAERYLSTHSEAIDSYPVRSVVMYGLSECERSRTCPEILRGGGVREFGRWMNISHDGDRVASWDQDDNSWPYALDYSDAAMDELIAKAEEGLLEADLAFQPGAYMCSVPQIDRMVDIALSVEGVHGAQILGAGLGGCILVLVHKDYYEDLDRAMTRRYYDHIGADPEMFPCSPVAGSGLVSF